MTMIPQKSPKIAKIFECIKCNYSCSKESDFKKHLLTGKHQLDTTLIKKTRQNNFRCNCGKTYKFRQGLSVHKKKCVGDKKLLDPDTNNQIIEMLIKELSSFKNIILDIAKNNSDLQKQFIDISKNINSHNTTNTHINSHNKTFNLQFFLNEQCKDAMNISDFVNTFDLQLSDLESVGNLGYVEGMTKIFLDKLSSMDVYKRPMHCSDARREIIYIKDENKWEKEHINNPKLHCAIKTLSFKNMKLTNVWSDTYPESKASESRLNDVYMKLVFQSTGGHGEISDNENKIIRKIAKEIVIDKTHF